MIANLDAELGSFLAMCLNRLGLESAGLMLQACKLSFGVVEGGLKQPSEPTLPRALQTLAQPYLLPATYIF